MHSSTRTGKILTGYEFHSNNFIWRLEWRVKDLRRAEGWKKEREKSTKIRENYTNQSIFLLWTIFKKSGRGTQKGIEVPKHSFQHFHTLYALWYSQLLYPIYLFFLFHNKAVLGQKVIFFTVNKESLYDSIRWQLLTSTSLCYLYSNKKPNWQSNKNVKIRDDLKFALQIHLTFKRGDLLPMFC